MKRLCLLLIPLSVPILVRADASVFDAIARGDTPGLQAALASGADPNVHDETGATAVMYAAAYGSATDLRLLIDAGAAVNTPNTYGATPLMWAASEPGKLQLLLEHGASVNARAVDRTTALLVAARLGAVESMRLLIAHGADPKATASDTVNLLRVAYASEYPDVRLVLADNGVRLKDPAGVGGPLLAQNLSDVATFRQLLEAGADPNQTVSLITLTLPTLNFASASGQIEPLRLLLSGGANARASGTHGWTPLMMAAGASRPNPAAVGLLLEKGVDVNARDEAGRTALDWALMQGDTPVAEQLRKAGGRAMAAPSPSPAAVSTPRSARDAIEKAVARLQPASPGFTSGATCVSCHHQSLPAMAVKLARDHGVPVDRALAEHPTTATLASWKAAREQYLLANTPAGGFIAGTPYALTALAEEGIARSPLTAAVALALANTQRRDGSWNLPIGTAGGGLRPPLGSIGAISLTALTVRGLSVYAPKGREAEMKGRVARALAFLRESAPADTQDEAFKLMGLVWSGVPAKEISAQADRVLALQRADGGWAQLPTMSADAYATGQALYALNAAGISTRSEAYQKGAAYLVRTQLADGTWLVRSRGFGFQPYFETGFPHGRDQFISAAATSWAVMGLAHVL
jgi:ankyrin repeat protein